ncbi:MAG: hypothetical protein M1830_006964 [Pleopsidium flavum]|nr:MAG: hypothetical protein M1830_006964 [Pleopsidium flavum]
MAAPPEVTLKDLSGKWVMNKTLSDDTDPILQMQGVNWFLRRAISLATITLTITQYTSPDPPHSTHIDIAQTATGGISGTTERRTLDWEVRGHKDGIFGEVRGKSRWVGLGELEKGGMEEFLRTGWTDEGGGAVVQSWVESVGGGWTAEQVWGFEEIEGERYHARHVIVRKGDDSKQARLVYDFQKK